MEIEWMRENMETEQVITAKPSQITVETEAALPGGLREEARVLYADAAASVSGGEWTGGRITADGKVIFHVLYAQGDMDRVRALETSADFAHALTVEDGGGAPGAARIRPRAEVVSVSAKAFNGRLLLKALLSLTAEAAAPRTVNCIQSAAEEGGVQRLDQTVTVERTVGEGEGQTLLREEFSLSDVLQITETLYAVAQAQVEDILGGADGRATVTGTIRLEAWHASDMPGRPLVNTRHTMPFEQAVNLSGALGDALTARSEVRDVAVLSQENEDGSRVMRAEVQLYSEITAVGTGEETILRDVFTTQGDAVSTQTETISYRSGTVNEQSDAPVRAVMILEGGAPRVKTALSGFVRPILTAARSENGQLTAEGVMELTLIYLTDDSDAVLSAQAETPFRAAFATAAGPEDHLQLTAGEVELSALTGDRVEFRCQARLSAEGVRQSTVAVITQAETAPAPAQEKGISLYYVQPGEGVWDIAKRYRTPLSEIKALNPQLPDQPPAGTAVITYQR